MDNLLVFLAQGTNLDLSTFRFRSNEAEAMNTLFGAGLAAVVIIAAAVFAFFYIRRRRVAARMAEQREEARLRLMVSELNLGRTEIEILRTLSGSDDTAELLVLLESRDAFEAAVQHFCALNPGHPVQKRVAGLRQRLEYGFSNVRNPFVDTRMLAPGTRLRCRIRHGQRDVSFLTTLLGINESLFIIRPPSAKGKPVGLGGLRELQFRVSRENDAEYEFTAPVVGQQPTGMRAVMCGHSRTISRLLFRNADRIAVNIPTELYVVRQEFTNERTAGHLKALDSQYRIDGVMRDISIGGALMQTEGHEQRLHEGDMVLFKLAPAQIADDLVSQVMGILPRDDNTTYIHLQFVGLRELNRLKLGKYLVSLKKEGATFSAGTKVVQQTGLT